MRKLILSGILSLFAASAAFSADVGASIDFDKAGLQVRGVNADGDKQNIGKLSNGVSLAAYTSDVGYVLVTQHKSGVKAYGTSFDSTAIFSHDVDKNKALTGVTLDGDSYKAEDVFLDEDGEAVGEWKVM